MVFSEGFILLYSLNRLSNARIISENSYQRFLNFKINNISMEIANIYILSKINLTYENRNN